MAQPFSPSDVTTPAPLAHAAIAPHLAFPLDPTHVLLGVWALGFAVVLIIWMTRWVRIRPLLRLATPLAVAAPMPVLASPTMFEPGLVGLWRPVLLVPDTLFDHLDRPGIEALVAHEACHFRRRDNLTGAIHMLVEALLWFHPMVWWIGGRLVEERERACDEAVVRAGHDPAVYAESLLECCRLFLQAPLRCVAGASGSNLSRRVELIMTSPFRSRLSRAGKAVLIATGLCALATPVAAGWLTTPTIRQAVTEVAAVASRPANALIHEAPAAQSAREQSDAAMTIAPARNDAAPAPRVQRITALRPNPIRLDPDADDQPPPELTRPRLPAAMRQIPDARLAPVTETQAPQATSPRGPTQLWLACKTVRILEPRPYVTHLCLAQSDWDKLPPQSIQPASGASP